MEGVDGKIHQPLHPSVREKLDPEYVALHDEILQYVLPSEAEPWDPASRLRPSPVAHGGQKLVDVGAVQDEDLGNFQIRIFTPEGDVPAGGWPVLVWLHGGGWVMGWLSSENGFLRHVCKYVRCAVITVNYRHAPEHVYPAAIEDSAAGYAWVITNAATLSLDTTRLAMGGLSAGGCLTAILSMKVASAGPLPVKPKFQLLLCPVIDNTADVCTVWSESQHAPWLTPTRMKWYRQKYFAKPAQPKSWDASPCYASNDLLSQSPKTFVGVAECDLLGPEALAYADLLKGAGVETEVKVYKGATHSILILAGIHRIGKELVHDACGALAGELGTSYDPASSPVLSQD
ncbi:Alpha/Beta hydrolase protein [Xylariomycetidae sp. FL2044]|nr:Alpha/Beta hydrolase protein [Xylariomycetidae sp. FL2044]